MFKKNLFLAIVLCNIIAIAQAMDTAVELPLIVKLPSAEKIRASFWNAGFAPFVTSTEIDTKLGDKVYNPVILSNIVDLYIFKYLQNLNEEARIQAEFGKNVVRPTQLNKAEVLKCILSDHPKAYAYLVVCKELPSRL